MFWVASALAAGPAPTNVVPVRTSEPIHVDGVLDEAVWQGPPIQGLVELDPVPGEADRGTRAWIAYDDRQLYVAFDARVDPGRSQSNALSARDHNRAEDTVAILLDTFRDGRRAYLFMVNGRGVQGDGIYVDDGTQFLGFPDLSWDGVFNSAAKFEDGRYTVEMAIPFRSLRFPVADQQTWNVVIVQNVPVPSSRFTWPAVDPNAAGVLTQAATLGPFPVGVHQGRLELLPTLTGIVDLAGPNPSPVSFGVGARFGITSSLTAEATVNPDFSQIESDVGQITVNVKYPLFYPERRPFFLENADLFTTPLDLVYTRSIVDPLGALKVTGRAGPVGIGVLGGYDEHPSPSTLAPADYASGAPVAVWGTRDVRNATAVDEVLRVRDDLGHGDSIGVLASDKELFHPDRPTLGNHVLGADGQLTAGRYLLTGQVLGSSTSFADGTTQSAPAWTVGLQRQGERWTYALGHAYLAPGFRAENGFLTEVGRTSFDARTQLLFHTPAVRLFGPGLAGDLSLDPGGAPVQADVGPFVNTSLGQRWNVNLAGNYRRERYQQVDFDLFSHSVGIQFQPASAWFVGLGWNVGQVPNYAGPDLYRGFNWSVTPNTNFDALGRMNVDLRVALDVFGRDPFGPPEFVQAIPRGQVSLALSPRWLLRVIEQYDTYASASQSSALLGYVANYGTVAYLGCNESAPGPSGRAEWTAFAKIGYLARL